MPRERLDPPSRLEREVAVITVAMRARVKPVPNSALELYCRLPSKITDLVGPPIIPDDFRSQMIKKK